MLTLLNILIIGLVLLIGYWWANQGLFSAILHLVAVIAAGTVALAVWEPLTLLALTGSGFDPYAWGVILIGVFVIALLLFRVGLDKIAPANVDMPHWANLACGFPLGAISGILTIGIFVIGAGHIQSQDEVMGLQGKARSQRTGQIEQINNLWVPVHTITADFYSWLSVTAFYAPAPLRHVNPKLDEQAVSLIRDSYNGGRGAITMPPDAVTVQSVAQPSATETHVALSFSSSAVDWNEQLTLSSSQVRLIGDASGFEEARTVHPFGWQQQGTDYRFNSITYYATSTPGQESANLTFHFRTEPDFLPRYIQVRGTRFNITQISEGDVTVAAGGPRPNVNLSAPSIDAAVEVTPRMRPIMFSKNSKPSGLDVDTISDDNYVTGTGGAAVEYVPGDRPSRQLRVEDIYAPSGTKVVQVQGGADSPAFIFRQSILDQLGGDATLRLVDTQGNTYSCIGYLQIHPNGRAMIKIDPDNFVRRLGDLPILPSSSEDELRLLFRVTAGQTIQALMFGDITVGTCNIYVDPEDNR